MSLKRAFQRNELGGTFLQVCQLRFVSTDRFTPVPYANSMQKPSGMKRKCGEACMTDEMAYDSR